MTKKELYYSAIKGDKVPKIPLWLEGFPLPPLPTEKDLQCGWMAEPMYRDLYKELAPHLVYRRQMDMSEAINRRLCIPGRYIEEDQPVYNKAGDRRVISGRIVTPRGALEYEKEQRAGISTTWTTGVPVHSLEELMQVFEIPFSVDENIYDLWYDRYLKLSGEMGDNGVIMLDLPSPMVAISDLMELELFLELSLTEKELFHELLTEITRRMLLIFSGFLSRLKLFAVATLGGAEQCTPPMMRPDSFDEYVVPYDSQVIALFKHYGIPVNMHCHGRVKHALSCMVDIGVNSTDPVEPPPSGDVTFEEAIRIADNKITLVGNFEFDELEYSSKEHIINRTKEILSFKGQRVIIGASGGPLSRVSPKLAENYRALLETYLNN